MLLEMAIGDAYGACFEWIDYDTSSYNHLEYVTIEPSLVPAGSYTDDTQMALALAEVMVAPYEWTGGNIADSFVRCFKRDERRGYTTALFQILLNCNSGPDLFARVHGTSDKSGAAMRSAPLGYFPLDILMDYSNVQAGVTHNSPVGLASAQAVALASHYFIYDLGPKDELEGWLRQYGAVAKMLEDQSTDPESGKMVSTNGAECTKAALRALELTSLSEILRESVSYGGDTDTVATIAMGIASNCREIQKDIPVNLIAGLENKEYGRDYLIEMDRRLKEKFLGG